MSGERESVGKPHLAQAIGYEAVKQGTRLPLMTNQDDLAPLLPKNWQPPG